MSPENHTKVQFHFALKGFVCKAQQHSSEKKHSYIDIFSSIFFFYRALLVTCLTLFDDLVPPLFHFVERVLKCKLPIDITSSPSPPSLLIFCSISILSLLCHWVDKCVEPGFLFWEDKTVEWRELEREGREMMRGRRTGWVGGGLAFSACFTVADYLLVSEVAQLPLTQRLADFSGSVDSPLESHMTGCSAEPLILHSKQSDLGGTGQKGRQMHVMTQTHI